MILEPVKKSVKIDVGKGNSIRIGLTEVVDLQPNKGILRIRVRFTGTILTYIEPVHRLNSSKVQKVLSKIGTDFKVIKNYHPCRIE